MDERELAQLLRGGAPLSLVVEAIDWPHQALRRGWDLARWRHVATPGAVLLWRVAEAAPPETETARRLRDLERERAEAAAAVERERRSGRAYFGGRDDGQQRVNALDWELAALRLHPDAPPEVRVKALAGNVANKRSHRESLRRDAAVQRHNARVVDRGGEHLLALAEREEAEAAALDAEIARLEAELATIPAPAPLAGILCVNADAARRDEYAPTAGEAGYPVTVLMRGEYTPGPARTALDAIVDGVLR
jgi:hypothetical protein